MRLHSTMFLYNWSFGGAVKALTETSGRVHVSEEPGSVSCGCFQ